MKNEKMSVKKRIETVKWAFQLAWKIDKKMLVIWFGLSTMLSIMPAISIRINQRIIEILSEYTALGNGNMATVCPYIVTFGVILIAIGLSARINKDFIYLAMYDSYYVGIQELLIQHAHVVDIESLQDRETVNQYISTVLRAASLTDFMSSACAFVAKAINIMSLLIIAIRSSQTIFVIALVYTIFMLILNQNYIEKLRKNDRKIRELNNRADYYEKLPRNLSAAKEIRLYESKQAILQQWEKAYGEIAEYEGKIALSTQRRAFLSGLCFYLFVITMICAAAVQVASGQMSPAVMIILISLCTDMYIAITGLVSVMMSAYDGLYYLNLQREMFEQYTSTIKTVSASCDIDRETVFKAEDLCFCYKDKTKAIQNLNFEIKKGEIVALVGENGSGKTTLVKLLLGLYKPNRGNLYFMGQPYDERNYEKIVQHIGVYFQDSVLLHKSVGDNIGYGNVSAINDTKSILEAADRGGASSVLMKLPHGLDTILGRQADKTGVELSGGEKQRIGVSRAHMSNKEVLIMDEPAAALDPIAELEQFEQIKEKIQGRTAILISHRLGFARMADKIIVMKDGHINDIGSHAELLGKGGVYAEMFNSQAAWYFCEQEDTNGQKKSQY